MSDKHAIENFFLGCHNICISYTDKTNCARHVIINEYGIQLEISEQHPFCSDDDKKLQSTYRTKNFNYAYFIEKNDSSSFYSFDVTRKDNMNIIKEKKVFGNNIYVLENDDCPYDLVIEQRIDGMNVTYLNKCESTNVVNKMSRLMDKFNIVCSNGSIAAIMKNSGLYQAVYLFIPNPNFSFASYSALLYYFQNSARKICLTLPINYGCKITMKCLDLTNKKNHKLIRQYMGNILMDMANDVMDIILFYLLF